MKVAFFTANHCESLPLFWNCHWIMATNCISELKTFPCPRGILVHTKTFLVNAVQKWSKRTGVPDTQDHYQLKLLTTATWIAHDSAKRKPVRYFINAQNLWVVVVGPKKEPIMPSIFYNCRLLFIDLPPQSSMHFALNICFQKDSFTYLVTPRSVVRMLSRLNLSRQITSRLHRARLSYFL